MKRRIRLTEGDLRRIVNRSVRNVLRETINSVNSISLPRNGWGDLTIWQLNIEYNGDLVDKIENRPKTGEVWLLSNEHVIGDFSDLEPSQQEAIK